MAKEITGDQESIPEPVRPDPPGWDTVMKGHFPFPSPEEVKKAVQEGNEQLRRLNRQSRRQRSFTSPLRRARRIVVIINEQSPQELETD